MTTSKTRKVQVGYFLLTIVGLLIVFYFLSGYYTERYIERGSVDFMTQTFGGETAGWLSFFGGVASVPLLFIAIGVLWFATKANPLKYVLIALVLIAQSLVVDYYAPVNDATAPAWSVYMPNWIYLVSDAVMWAGFGFLAYAIILFFLKKYRSKR